MRRPLSLASAILLLAGPAGALAENELPKRRPGLWEYTYNTTTADEEMTYQQCVDPMADRLAVGVIGKRECTLPAYTKVGDAYHGDMTCGFGAIKAKTNTIITGDYDSRLRVAVVTEVAMPGLEKKVRRESVMEMHWVGPCADGMKPGDVVLPGGKIVKTPGIPG